MNKPSRSFAKPLRDLLAKVVGETFTRQGFASAELVTRWTEIVGAEIAAHSEPVKIQWQHASPSLPSSAGGEGSGRARPPGTLILRVEGPAAVEVQHLADVICERVNRFLGWRAIERIALRQAPLRHASRPSTLPPDPAEAARIAAGMPEIADEDLKQALARLGAAVRHH
ncbi:MAG: DciA family protein [Xanthobacteraceae bacterium]|nr:DciA family protein [Xanthobacteraceae bacterium]